MRYDERGEPIFWYGMNGKPIGTEEANRLLGDDRRIVRRTTLKDGRTRITVSTVFLVLDHGFSGKSPVRCGKPWFSAGHSTGTWTDTHRDAGR